MPEDIDSRHEYLDKIYSIFVQWFVIPKEDRIRSGIPKDMNEFCEKYSVEPHEAHAFFSYPTFYADLREKTFEWAKQRTPELMQLMYEKIKKEKSATDMRLWLEMVESLNKKGEASGATNLYFLNLPEDVQEQIARRAYRKHGLLPAGSEE